MKTKALFVAALVVISSVVAAAGKDEPRKTGMAVVPVKGSEVFKVIYKGETTGKVKVTIYNSNGETLMTETISGVDGFIWPVNFRGLASGEYTIEIADATGKKVEKISYSPTKSIKHVHVSKLANDDSKFLLAIANTGAEQIQVRIFDSKNNLVFVESKDINGDFAQVYKLANVTESYTFQVSDKNGNIKSITF